jgi:hypothetical protein
MEQTMKQGVLHEENMSSIEYNVFPRQVDHPSKWITPIMGYNLACFKLGERAVYSEYKRELKI